MLFHARSDIHRIAPDIVSELFRPDDSRYYRPAIDADPDFKHTLLPSAFFDELKNFKCSCHAFMRMPWIAHRYATNGDVGITYGFDFFEAMLLHNRIESRKAFMQFLRQNFRRKRLTYVREVDKVRVEHADIFKILCVGGSVF